MASELLIAASLQHALPAAAAYRPTAAARGQDRSARTEQGTGKPYPALFLQAWTTAPGKLAEWEKTGHDGSDGGRREEGDGREGDGGATGRHSELDAS